jgi:hypothetical protein
VALAEWTTVEPLAPAAPASRQEKVISALECQEPSTAENSGAKMAGESYRPAGQLRADFAAIVEARAKANLAISTTPEPDVRKVSHDGKRKPQRAVHNSPGTSARRERRAAELPAGRGVGHLPGDEGSGSGGGEGTAAAKHPHRTFRKFSWRCGGETRDKIGAFAGTSGASFQEPIASRPEQIRPAPPASRSRLRS